MANAPNRNSAWEWLFAQNSERTVYSRNAAAQWMVSAGTGAKVLLVEHDSILISLMVLADYVAKPELGELATSGGTVLDPPYCSIEDTDADGKTVRVAAVGLYQRPMETEAAKWWDLIQAAIWRLADLAKFSADELALTDPRFVADTNDAVPVYVFGESNTESIITQSPANQWMTEDEQAVIAAVTVFTGAADWVSIRAGGSTRLNAQQTEALAEIMGKLGKEKEQIEYRARLKGTIVGAAILLLSWVIGNDAMSY